MATIGVAVAALAAMATSITGPFLFDDVPLISGNTNVHSFDHLDKLLAGNLWDTNFTPLAERQTRGFWRPAVLVGYALNWVVGGGEPFWFHVVNLLLHGANSVLVALALRRFSGSDAGAIAGAAVFAVHPVQVETVAWIAGRTDSMCLLGLLVATSGYGLRLRGRRAGVVPEVLGAAFALSSKESFVLLPIFLALECWAAAGRPPLGEAPLRRFVTTAAPHLVAVIGYAVAHRLFVQDEVVALGVTWANRGPLVLEALGRYVALVAWPDDLTLGRALFSFRGGAIAPHLPLVALGGAGLALGALVAWRTRTTAPSLAAALLAFVALLVPVSGVVWLDYDVLVSPRFLYVPMVAVAFLVAEVVSRWWGNGRERLVAAGLALALIPLAARSAIRASDFSDTERFWRAEIERNPRYTSAQLHFIGREMQHDRPHAALRLAHDSFAALTRAGDPELARAGLVLPILHALSRMTPDLDEKTLGDIATFVADVLDARHASLTVPRLDLRLEVGESSGMGPTLRLDAHRFRLVRAAALSRLGRDSEAIDAMVPALDGCADCWTLMNSAMPIALRAARFDLAQRILSAARPVMPTEAHAALAASVRSATELHAAATAEGSTPFDRIALHSTLGAHARAYRIGREEYDRDPTPRAALGLGELAVVAGDVELARTLFRKVASAQEAEAQIAAIELAARRRDQPVGADYYTPVIR